VQSYLAVGIALADADRRLVYGGGSKGIMGIVSGAVLEHGGQVTGIIPYAIIAAGGEGNKNESLSDLRLHVNESANGRKSTVSFLVLFF
jgi:predicted Rossmann-fold nucleotide-binding protein